MDIPLCMPGKVWPRIVKCDIVGHSSTAWLGKSRLAWQCHYTSCREGFMPAKELLPMPKYRRAECRSALFAAAWNAKSFRVPPSWLLLTSSTTKLSTFARLAGNAPA